MQFSIIMYSYYYSFPFQLVVRFYNTVKFIVIQIMLDVVVVLSTAHTAHD